MKKLLLALCLIAGSAHAQYIDGLPPITSLAAADILPICQGGTVIPGTCTTRKVTVLQLQGIATGFYVRLTGDTMTGTLGGTSLAMSANGSFGGTLGVTGTGTFAGSLIAGGAGSAPLTLSSGSIAVASGQNLAFTTGGATRTVTFGNSGAGLGNALTITSGAGANTLDAANPNTVAVNNLLNVNRIRNTTAGNVLTGLSAFPAVSFFTNTYSGTYTPTDTYNYLHQFIVNSDTANIAETAAGTGVMAIRERFGGSPAGGSRRPFFVEMVQDGAMAVNGSMQFENFATHATYEHSLGGSDTSTNSKGSHYGWSSNATMKSGALNYTLLNPAGEVNAAVQTGATLRDFIWMHFSFFGSHRVAGAGQNYGIVFSGQPATLDPGGIGATPTLGLGIAFGADYGRWPLASTGTMFGTVLQTANGNSAKNADFPSQLATKGIDLGFVDFATQSGQSLFIPGFSVSGTGEMGSSNFLLSHSSTGINLDIPYANRITAVAISVAGTGAAGVNNYAPGNRVYGAQVAGIRAQYRITNTQVIAAAVVSGGTGGTPGAVTVTGTTGTGTKFQATGTISGLGVLTGALTVTVPGNYTVNPTSLTAEPVTGGGLSGATVSLGVGALTVAVVVPDVSASTPATITPTGGSGTGLVLSTTWASRNAMTLASTGGPIYFKGPIVSVQAASTAYTTATTMTAAALANGHITGNPTGGVSVNYQLPTCANFQAVYPALADNDMVAFTVENISTVASSYIIITTNTGWTLPGATTIWDTTQEANTARRFGARRTGASTCTLVGIS